MLVASLARKLFVNPEFLGCILRKRGILEGYLGTISFQTYIKKILNQTTTKKNKGKIEMSSLINLSLSNLLCFFRAKHTFAATRPSAVLIEQLAVCVVKGEPVLLVGETGTGKTSAVQYLAHITGK